MIRRSRLRPTTRALAALVVLAALLVPLAPGAGANPLDEKRAEAARLQSAIEANGERLSMLAEDYNNAVLAVETSASQIAEAERKVDAARREQVRLRALVNARAASLYRGAGTTTPLDEIETSSVQELGSRAHYSEAINARDGRVIDDLVVQQEQLAEQQATLAAAKAEAEAEQEALESRLDEVEAAQEEQQRLLGQVQGEIAELVRQEEARRQAEEERRARDAAQRRQAEEAARRAAQPAAAPATPAAPGRGAATTTTTRPPTRGGGTTVAPPPASVPAPNPRAQVAVDAALSKLGAPYRYAGKGPDVFDCSGLTGWAWAQAGVRLPPSSQTQYAGLPKIPQDALAPGDLLFYGRPIHHVGMYIGNGQMVHAPQTGDVVKISSIHRSNFVGAARPG